MICRMGSLIRPMRICLALWGDQVTGNQPFIGGTAAASSQLDTRKPSRERLLLVGPKVALIRCLSLKSRR